MDLSKSPFRRLREATGLSGAEFTRSAAIARTTTVYLDAGLMLVPRATAALEQELWAKSIDAQQILQDEYDSEELSTATTLWQRTVRKSHADRINDAYVIWDESNGQPEVDPFTEFVGYAFENRDQFCKAMKVQTGPIKLWLESTTRPLPPTLNEALLDAGLTPKEIANLESEVNDWREKHVGPAA